MPNAIARIFMRLMGKSWAYESVEDVREVIAENSYNAFAERARTHARGAARLNDFYAFQPGLVAFHDDMHDGWHYLTALKARADALGCASLTDSLEDAATAMAVVLQDIAEAAEATVPHPQVPPK
ncbi:hypothetical protein [Streptomyces sp. NPDC001948]